MFVADCPRCGHLRTTFDILAQSYANTANYLLGYECFMQCRSCLKPSIGMLRQINTGNYSPEGFLGQYANPSFKFEHWVFNVPNRRITPEHVPPEIGRIFAEGASCAAIDAWDAAGAMFRKVLDASTRDRTPKPDSGENPEPPNWKTYKDLRLRLDWLFETGRLDRSLVDLSSCIHQDGNDAAHDVVGIGKEEAEDLADFTERVLEVIYTFPGQIDANKKRRDERRAKP